MAKQDGIQYDVEGVKEITEMLDELGYKIKSQVIRSFNRKALTTQIVKPLRAALPYSSVKREIKVQNTRYNNNTAVVAGPTSKVFYVRFLEKGTKQRKGPRGAIMPRPIIEPFVDGQVKSVIKFTSKEYGNEVERIMKKKLRRKI